MNTNTHLEQTCLENTILDCCKSVGLFLKKGALNIQELNWKEVDDPVTDLDKNAEKMIKDILTTKICANYYGEEYGIEQNGANINIYIDPIDGTKSLARGE